MVMVNGNGRTQFSPMTATRRVKIALVASVAMALTSCGGGAPPEALRDAGVRYKRIAVRKAVVLESRQLGLVSDVRTCGGQTIAVGQSVCVRDGARTDCERVSNVFADRIVRNNAKGCDFTVVGRADWGRRFVAVDRSGVEVWARPYTTALHVDTLIVNAAGREQMLLGDRGSGSILLDPVLGTVSRFPIDAEECAAGNLVADHRSEIVCLERKADRTTFLLTVRDLKGALLSEITPPDLNFRVTRTVTPYAEVAVSGEDGILLFNGELARTRHLRIAPVDFYIQLESIAEIPRSGGDVHFASVSTGRGGWDRAILLVHNSGGELLYHEVLDTRARIVEPVTDGFLVGARHVVYSYKLGES